MVRQDKISYLITGFRSTQLVPIYPKEPLVDLFIRTILSQGTDEELRDKAFQNLKLEFPDWKTLLDSDINKIIKLINICGLSNQKTHTIISFIKWIFANFNELDLEPIRLWEKERLFSELTSIQGIGIITVSIFVCFGLERASFPVDNHIQRIFTRIGVTSNYTSPYKVFERVKPFIPVGRELFLHTHLVEFGKNICKSSIPICNRCMFNDQCDFFNNKNKWTLSLIKV
jgi:endonuclease III